MIVSPHLDDAVFACGDVMAGCPGVTVVTLFAGGPPAGAPLTPWDADAGFRAGDDVMAARREEDRRALARLRARAVWLDFLDAQYGGSPEVASLAATLAEVLGREAPATVYFPLGLFHSDHLLASDACLALAGAGRTRGWLVYADALYRAYDGLLPRRLAALREQGFQLAALPGARPASALKCAAMAEYASQLRALHTPGRPGIADALAPEQLWRLTT
ncbi:MAG: PIG-L deacetylase family protein [Candidatus Methylomirabilales bacterium]